MASKMVRGKDGKYAGLIGAGTQAPKPAKTVLTTLTAAKAAVDTSTDDTIALAYKAEIARFELALKPTANPFTLLKRAGTRKKLQKVYGIINWAE
jgi:hypothetical protein